jgi:hypothetical protein
VVRSCGCVVAGGRRSPSGGGIARARRAFGHVARRIDAIFRNKLRRTQVIRRLIVTRPCTVNDVATQLVVEAIRSFQRQMVVNETLSHIAFLRWSALIEGMPARTIRRRRPVWREGGFPVQRNWPATVTRARSRWLRRSAVRSIRAG